MSSNVHRCVGVCIVMYICVCIHSNGVCLPGVRYMYSLHSISGVRTLGLKTGQYIFGSISVIYKLEQASHFTLGNIGCEERLLVLELSKLADF